jgi:polyhydroxyalkanoate synthesis regulator phasin
MAEFGQQDKGFGSRPKILEYLGTGDLSQDNARGFASELVRRARSEGGRFVEGVAPAPGEVRERREAHQHSDA